MTRNIQHEQWLGYHRPIGGKRGTGFAPLALPHDVRRLLQPLPALFKELMKYRLRNGFSTSTIGTALSLFLALGAAAASASTGPLPGQLQAYEGKLVYLDFWASWCTPCAQSFPWLNEMQARYGDKISIIAVNLDQDATSARAFLARHPARFPVIFDPAGTIASRYQIDGMPSTVVVAPGGGVIHRHSGFLGGKLEEYEAVIRGALSAPVDATR